MTEKQAQVLAYIEQRLARQAPPSQREIAAHFGLTQNAVYQLVGYLRKKGYLASAGGHRGLRLTAAYAAQRQAATGLPVIGRVAAGTPILAEENIERYLDLGTLFAGRGRRFCLQVVGDSMVDAGILDGDYVVVQAQPVVDNHAIAVVLVGDEATVKQVRFDGRDLVLTPANRVAGYRPQRYPRDREDVRVVGKVIGCVRQVE